MKPGGVFGKTLWVACFAALSSLGAETDNRSLLNTALASAVRNGDAAEIDRLITAGADPNLRRSNGTRLLGIAVEHEQTAAFTQLLSRGARMNSQEPLFLVAAQKRNRTLMQTLVAVRYDFRAARAGMENLIVWAVQTGNVEAAEVLLNSGMSPDSRSHINRSLLDLAAERGDPIFVQMLLKAGARVDGPPLLSALRNQHLQIARMILERINSADVGDFQGWAIHAAIDTNDPDLVGLVLSKGAKVNRLDGNKRTALYRAVELFLQGAHDEDTLEKLIQARPDANIPAGDTGVTPLMLAAMRGRPSLSRRLLEIGARADAVDRAGTTPLIFAVSGGVEINPTRDRKPVPPADRLACIRMLLDAGVRVDHAGHHKRTALWWAAHSGLTAETKLLVEKGANPNLSDRDGISPVEAARRSGQRSILAVLSQ